jgi:FtsP/CotA-like multicopper oxidase with cupredoxin domain
MLALTLGGCGGDGSSGTKALVIVADQSTVGFGGFDVGTSLGWGTDDGEATAPGPRISVPSGVQVAVTLINDDEVDEKQHDFAVVANLDDRFPQPLWDSQTGGIGFGAETSIEFTSGDPGVYFYVCLVGDHRDRGMFGEFVVEE